MSANYRIYGGSTSINSN